MRRVSGCVVASVVVVALVAGCGGGEEAAEPETSASSVSASEGVSESASESPSPTPTVEPADGKVARSGYVQVNAPRGWEIDEALTQNASLLIGTRYQAGEKALQALSVLSLPNPVKSDTLEQSGAAFINADDKFDWTREVGTDLDGEPSVRWLGQETKDRHSRQFSVVAFHDGWRHTLAYNFDYVSVEEARATFDSILATWKWLDK